MYQQLLGIIIFISILLFIYSINSYNRNNWKNYNNKNIEGFTLNELGRNRELYHEVSNSYFGLDEKHKLESVTLNEAMEKCNIRNDCLGITRKNTTQRFNPDEREDYYIIRDTGRCRTKYFGSAFEKNEASKYTSYIKKSVGNVESLCITDETIDKGMKVSIESNDNLIVLGLNETNNINPNIVGYSKPSIKVNNLYPLTSFKIVKGLVGDGTISIQHADDKYKSFYVSHNFPKTNHITLKQVRTNQKDLARMATFRIVPSLNKKGGFSLRLLDFPDVYVRLEGNKRNNDNLMVAPRKGLGTNEFNNHSTFNIRNELNQTSFDDMESSETTGKNILEDDENNVNILNPQDKFRIMKNKNLFTLDKQSVILENQNKKLRDFSFIHSGNINKIGREFAKQSADIALSKFLEDKDEILLLEKKLNSKNMSGDNIPSIKNMNTL